ncbi:hypothetical protein M5K25_008375 [Dendrobium thyrsiflorum]|uniref:Uncharacterized protein n=1 Tax=Dendrobium thyrsiflorum TaxID=117978 RepID=A0ABD0V8I5_DENTH
MAIEDMLTNDENIYLMHNLLEDFFLYKRFSSALDKRHPLSNYKAPLYTEALMGDHPSLRDPMTKRDPRPAVHNDGKKRSCKVSKIDDMVSNVIDDCLIVFHKSHFSNDLVVMAPKRSDRVCLPPIEYLIIYEISLRVGLRFPPPPKLIDIPAVCRVSHPSFHTNYGGTNHFLQRSRENSDTRMHFLGWANLLAMRRNASHSDPNCWTFVLEVRKMGVDEGFARSSTCWSRRYYEDAQFGLSVQATRSIVMMLKKSTKKKLEGSLASTNKVPLNSSPAKLHISEDMLNHQCVKRRRADDLVNSHRMDIEVELTQSLNEWNNEFVKIKFLQEEYKRKYDHKTKEMKAVKNSSHDQTRSEGSANLWREDSSLEDKNKRFQSLIAKKEVALVAVEGLTPNQASDDPPSDSDDYDDIESELRKVFSNDDEVVKIEVVVVVVCGFQVILDGGYDSGGCGEGDRLEVDAVERKLLQLGGEGKRVVEVELLLAGMQSREIDDLRLQFHKIGSTSGIGVRTGTAVHAPLPFTIVPAFGTIHGVGVTRRFARG